MSKVDARLQVNALDREMASHLATLRHQRGMSVEHIARVIGVHPTGINRLDVGKRTLRYGEAFLMADALGEPLDKAASRAACLGCHGLPPTGFTCNTCGAVGAS